MDARAIFIYINNSFIDINKSFIGINKSFIGINKSFTATAPNTTTSMTDVPCYRTAIITTALVVDGSLGIYPTVEGCGVPGPFNQNFTSLVTPP